MTNQLPLVNAWLQKQSAEAKPWDIGGQVRAQYDAKDDAGSFPDSVPDRDFIRSGQDNDNAYFLLREKIHLGYTAKWWNIFLEARDSSSIRANQSTACRRMEEQPTRIIVT